MSTTDPNSEDFAFDVTPDERGQYGSGPTLKNPDSAIQNSTAAENQHLEKATHAVGGGPSLGNPTERSEENQNINGGPGHDRRDSVPGTSTFSKRSSVDADAHHHRISRARTAIGLEAEAPVVEEHKVHEHLAWSTVRMTLREPLAEFFGTFILVLFGNGSVAQVLLSTGETSAPGGDGFGPYQSINWGWGLGVMLGVYVAGDSGGFLNPAITLGFCTFRTLPWRRFPIYMLAQFLGGFCASGVVYANYINAINAFEGHGIRTVPPSKTATAGIFATYPQPFVTRASQFCSEFIASTILMFVIFALKDDSNSGAMGKTGMGPLFPLALLFLIFGLGACFGWETGYAINLARDFGPRLMSFCVGYGHEVWSAGGFYFWIPMVAPFCGCLFGGALYDMFLYTGPESPVNTPWLGFKYLLGGGYRRRRKEVGMYDV